MDGSGGLKMEIDVKKYQEDMELVAKVKIVNEIFLLLFSEATDDIYVDSILESIEEKLEEVMKYVNEYYTQGESNETV